MMFRTESSIVLPIEAELRELRAARDEPNDRIRELVRKQLVYAAREQLLDVDLAA